MDEANCDPLSLLRRYNLEKREIVEDDNYIIFGKFYWPKTVNTNYYKRGSGNDEGAKEYYTLECLVNFLKNVNLPHPSYVRQADAKGIAAVRRPDRKDLLKYLNGEISWSTNIDDKVAVVLAQVRGKTDPAPPGVEEESSGSTNAKVTVLDSGDDVALAQASADSGDNKHKLNEETAETMVKKQKVDRDGKDIIKEKELEQ